MSTIDGRESATGVQAEETEGVGAAFARDARQGFPGSVHLDAVRARQCLERIGGIDVRRQRPSLAVEGADGAFAMQRPAQGTFPAEREQGPAASGTDHRPGGFEAIATEARHRLHRVLERGCPERRRARGSAGEQPDHGAGDDEEMAFPAEGQVIEIGTRRGARSGAALRDAAVRKDHRYREGGGLPARARNAPLASGGTSEPGANRARADRRQERSEGRRCVPHRGLEGLHAAAGFHAGDSGRGVDGDDAVQLSEVEDRFRACSRAIALASDVDPRSRTAKRRHGAGQRGNVGRDHPDTRLVARHCKAGGFQLSSQVADHETSFPGLRIPCGSNARLRASSCAIPSPCSRGRKDCLWSPMPW